MTRPRRGRKAALIAMLAATTLAACSPVPRSTMRALHDFDLSTVPAESLRLAVRSSDALRLDGGAPVLTVTVGINGAVPTAHRYGMTEVAVPAGLAAEARQGSILRVFGLDARSAAELNAHLADLRQSAVPGERQLSVGLAINGCRTDGRIGGGLPVTTFVQLAPTEPFLVLTRERELASYAAMAGYAVEVPACG